MRNVLQDYLALAGDVSGPTRQRATAAARGLVRKGEAATEQVSALAEDLVEQSRASRDAVGALVRYEVDRALGRVGLAGADEVAELSARVRALETTVRELDGHPGRREDASSTG